MLTALLGAFCQSVVATAHCHPKACNLHCPVNLMGCATRLNSAAFCRARVCTMRPWRRMTRFLATSTMTRCVQLCCRYLLQLQEEVVRYFIPLLPALPYLLRQWPHSVALQRRERSCMSWTRGCRSMLVGFVLVVWRESCSVDVKCNRC